MTREELKTIIQEESEKEVQFQMKDFPDGKVNLGELLSEVMATSISAATQITLSVLERAGVLNIEN